MKKRPPKQFSVNCWFCNHDVLIRVSKQACMSLEKGAELGTVTESYLKPGYGVNDNCWICPACKQYNGFDEEGSYNVTLRRMYREDYNPGKFSILHQNNVLLDNHMLKNISFSPCSQCLIASELEKRKRKDDSDNDNENEHEDIILCPSCLLYVQSELKRQDLDIKHRLLLRNLQKSEAVRKKGSSYSREKVFSYVWNRCSSQFLLFSLLLYLILGRIYRGICHHEVVLETAKVDDFLVFALQKIFSSILIHSAGSLLFLIKLAAWISLLSLQNSNRNLYWKHTTCLLFSLSLLLISKISDSLSSFDDYLIFGLSASCFLDVFEMYIYLTIFFVEIIFSFVIVEERRLHPLISFSHDEGDGCGDVDPLCYEKAETVNGILNNFERINLSKKEEQKKHNVLSNIFLLFIYVRRRIQDLFQSNKNRKAISCHEYQDNHLMEEIGQEISRYSILLSYFIFLFSRLIIILCLFVLQCSYRVLAPIPFVHLSDQPFLELFGMASFQI